MSAPSISALNPTVTPVETLSIKIDGKPIDVPRTFPDPLTRKPIPTTMIQACALAKVDVPHYCYHPKLPVAGNCRMCMVEFGTPAMGPDRKPILNPDGTPRITKSPRPAIACATPISPGMEIYTDTPSVKQMQASVLEFLLINHPLDCPICDQAGECKLQEYSVEYGHSTSRFVEEKVHKPKQVDLGPRIVLDDERCILCSRCVRFTRDIVGDDALGFINRGSYNTLTNFPGKSFDNNYTLNTVDICPVGALTSKDFRFKMRVWFLKESRSICGSCGTGCNTIISSRENRIYRYEPRENDAVNSSWMCDYGRLNYKWVLREDRLRQVLRRRGASSPEPMDWPTAIREISALLKRIPRGSSALVASARQTNEELYLLKRLADYLGAITDSAPRIGEADHLLLNADRNSNTQGVLAAGLAAGPLGASLSRILDGIQNGTIRTLLVFGEDLLKHGFTKETLRKVENLIVSDILPSGTTALAHYLLPGAAYPEKRGTFTNLKGRVQRFWKAIEPPGEARPEADFLQELLAGTIMPSSPLITEGLFNQMAKEVPAYSGLTWAGLGEAGSLAQIPMYHARTAGRDI